MAWPDSAESPRVHHRDSRLARILANYVQGRTQYKKLTDALERVVSVPGSSGTPLGRTTLTIWLVQDGILEEGERKMVKTEDRPVKVKICDFCGEEVDGLSKCFICKRDMCNAGLDKHASHTLGVYSFGLQNTICSAYVCKECAEKKIDLTIGQMLDGMFGESPVPTINVVKGVGEDWLSEQLIELGFVTREQVAQVVAHTDFGTSVVDELLKRKLVTHAQIATAKAAQFGTQVIVLRDTLISSVTIGLVPPRIARKYRVIPVEKIEDHVVIAIEDPSDLNTIDTFGHLLNADIEIRVATEDDIEAALKKYYPDDEERGKKLRQESGE